ncbi:hypothetical protein BpHYR1_025212, partial [Brachionus plicatilis]
IPRAIDHEEIIKSTKEDPALQEVISRLRGSKFNFKNQRDLKAKQVIKCNGDRKLRAKESQLNIDELVLYQKPRGKVFDKKEPVRDPNPWRVEEVNGSMVTARSSD